MCLRRHEIFIKCTDCVILETIHILLCVYLIEKLFITYLQNNWFDIRLSPHSRLNRSVKCYNIEMPQQRVNIIVVLDFGRNNLPDHWSIHRLHFTKLPWKMKSFNGLANALTIRNFAGVYNTFLSSNHYFEQTDLVLDSF